VAVDGACHRWFDDRHFDDRHADDAVVVRPDVQVLGAVAELDCSTT
jgi:hypothetical protein